MSDQVTELRDLRAKITPLAWAWIEAESRATHRDQSEVVRAILQQWAEQRSTAATVAERLMRCEGSGGKGGERGA